MKFLSKRFIKILLIITLLIFITIIGSCVCFFFIFKSYTVHSNVDIECTTGDIFYFEGSYDTGWEPHNFNCSLYQIKNSKKVLIKNEHNFNEIKNFYLTDDFYCTSYQFDFDNKNYVAHEINSTFLLYKSTDESIFKFIYISDLLMDNSKYKFLHFIGQNYIDSLLESGYERPNHSTTYN